MDTAAKIKDARSRKGLTQQRLGELLGYESGVAISVWESGRRIPNAINLREIAKALDVTTDYLLGVGVSQ